MATFPTLNPSSRVFTPGEYPHTRFTSLSGAQNRVRNSNVMLSSELRLTFVAITEADMLSILSHYQAQQGNFSSFLLPSVVWNGTDSPSSYQLTGYGWVYKQPPTVEDLMCGGHNVELSLESVPPEGTALTGLDQTVVVSIAGGIATSARGVELTVVASIDGGVAGVAGLSEAVTWSLAAGVATADAVVVGMAAMVYAWLDQGFNASSPGANLDVIASLQPGSWNGGNATGLEIIVVASIDGGTASAALTDPYFSSVSLLLHMNGSDNSTSIIDSSQYAHTITATGSAKLKTSSAKYGTAGLRLDGSAGYLQIPSHASFDMGTGPFTIEFWCYSRDQTNNYPAYVANGGSWGTSACSIRFDGYTLYQKFSVNCKTTTGGEIQFTTNIYSFNVWRHVAVVRNGTSMVIYVDGTQAASATIGSSAEFNWSAGGYLYIGYSWDGSGSYINEDMDEVRITKGVARYTSNFAAPSAAFPDS